MEDNSNTVVQNAVDYLLSNDSEYESMNNNIQENSQVGGVDYNNNYNLSKSQINQVNETLSANTDKSFVKMKKFVKAMHKKYDGKKLSLPEIVQKSRKHASKIGIRDSEYKLFEVLYQNILDENNNVTRNGVLGSTQVNKLGNSLGSVKAPYIDNKKLKFGSQDKPFIDEIMRIAVTNAAEHSTVVMQTQMYNIHGVEKIVKNALLSKVQHNVSCAAHPLIVALFAPKITILDERMLLSNLARLIVDRIEGKPVRNKADFEFFVDLTTDQQEFVCDSKSLFHDMLKRIHVQEMLRKNVWQMRAGQFFDCDSTKLIQALDQCSLNPSESPHLLYVRDEGQMLRRLLAAFSFKPTHVTTRPIFAFNMAQPSIGRLDQLSIVNCNIPHYMFKNDVDEPIRLEDGLKTPHWYIQEKLVVPKQQNLVYSREVIFFYINRRYTSLGNAFDSSYMFNRAPTSMTGFNQVNRHPVKFSNGINLHQYPYILRSCVCVTKNEAEEEHSDSSKNWYNGCQSFIWMPDKDGKPTGLGDRVTTAKEFEERGWIHEGGSATDFDGMTADETNLKNLVEGVANIGSSLKRTLFKMLENNPAPSGAPADEVEFAKFLGRVIKKIIDVMDNKFIKSELINSDGILDDDRVKLVTDEIARITESAGLMDAIINKTTGEIDKTIKALPKNDNKYEIDVDDLFNVYSTFVPNKDSTISDKAKFNADFFTNQDSALNDKDAENFSRLLSTLAILKKIDSKNVKSHSHEILKYNPYSYFNTGVGKEIENEHDLSGVFKYCEGTEECYDFIERNATVFVYSQKMTDVRGELPFQRLGIHHFPAHSEADKFSAPKFS